MKKAILICLVFFFITAGQTLGNVTWCDAEISPQNPTSSDVVSITMSGWWGSSCIPNDSTISVVGNDIYFDVILDYPPDIICLTVMTEWERMETVDPLPPGTYDVYVRPIGYPYIPDTYQLITQFIVMAHEPIVYYVNATDGDDNNDGLSPETAFATIQKAIDTAYHGDTVIVAEGTYYENINFNSKAITVRSANPDDSNIVESTIIDANGVGSVVTFSNGEGRDSILQGFTLTGGTGTNIGSSTGGGAIYCKGVSPTISQNIMVGNNAPNYGGAVFSRTGSNPLLTKNIIKSNSSHWGGAVYTYEPIEVRNNIICYNTATWGGGLLLRDWCMVINNLVYNNASSSGGGIALRSADNSIVTGNTIAGNSSNSTNPANLEIEFSDDVIVANNIIANGINGTGIALYQASVILKYNNVWNNEGGNYEGMSDPTGMEGNISVNPLFVDTNVDNYHLQLDSPCINAGDPNYVPEPNETDLDGNPRIIGDRIDMGVYEFNPPIEAHLRILPPVINRSSRRPRIMAIIRLPEGITKGQVDGDTPLTLYPSGIESIYQRIIQYNRRGSPHTIIFALFSKNELMNAVTDNGRVELEVVGNLKTGQYFYGTDTVWIKSRRWLPWRRHHR